MATNEILQFASSDTGTNLLTQVEYSADAQRTIGNQPGIARSKLVNKALRQLSTIAAGVAEFIADNQATNITDGLTAQNISDYFTAALRSNLSSLSFAAGTAAAPSISAVGDSNTGLYFPAADTVAISTGGIEALRVDSSRNVLIGTTSLIDGRVSITANTGNSACIGTSDNGLTTYYPATFKHSGVVRGSIATTNAGTNFNTSSDYRLKENVQPMQNALAKVAQLKPCTYKWKADGSDGDGFVAHELAEVCPNAVTGEKDAVNEDGSIKPQGIDTSRLVGVLAAALQEAHGLIKELTSRIEALEAK